MRAAALVLLVCLLASGSVFASPIKAPRNGVYGRSWSDGASCLEYHQIEGSAVYGLFGSWGKGANISYFNGRLVGGALQTHVVGVDETGQWHPYYPPRLYTFRFRNTRTLVDPVTGIKLTRRLHFATCTAWLAYR